MSPVASLANAGLPMLALHLPLMLLALVPVVAVEQFRAGQLLDIERKQLWNGVIVAKLMSTFVGWPIAWLLMVVVNFSGASLIPEQVYGSDSPIMLAMLTIIHSSWLGPNQGAIHWMIPLATLVMLVPYFFISVFVEARVLRSWWRPTPTAVIRRIAWQTNAISYAVLVLSTSIWLVWALVSQ